MLDRSQILTAAATLAICLGCGQWVQSGSGPSSAAPGPAPTRAPIAITPLSASTEAPPMVAPLQRLGAVAGVAQAPAPLLAEDAAEPALPGCPEPALTLAAVPGGQVKLQIDAPCLAGLRFELRHAGLVFSERLAADGLYAATIPALTEEAGFNVHFDDGTDLRGELRVPDLAGIRRAGIEWAGPAALALNAYEGAATWGEPGHLRADRPAAEGHGTLVAFGDPSLRPAERVQIYTAPIGSSVPVRLEMEAEVTADSCGQEARATALEAEGLQPVTLSAVTLALPDCDALDGFVVLNLPALPAAVAVAAR